ncbi:AraC family transcriptional regulator [Pedobacter sp. MC2016-05]|uniref:AraC family transcriptional regulator n=1 Tax=Pedobacter sp. MC2016-05 TaxID=2994474 RepID=UPI00224711C2|nr:AraC family transcriptional regulator [Pedobacter sp. MC2016-05]MCX2477320.1 AraC family transcriptional regulator [Pedobacter sp. MC2016-05]
MNKIINFRSFNVFILEKEHWDYGYHSHNFYELILIEVGKGTHRLNEIDSPYKKGDVFLLTPADKHEFSIEEKTKFLYIKFTEDFLTELLVLKHDKMWKDTLMLSLLAGSQFSKVSLINSNEEGDYVFQLSKMLLYEFTSHLSYNQVIIANLFSSLLVLLVRNMNKIEGRDQWVMQDGEKIENILAYIRVNALDKQKMKIQTLADQFLISPNYISFFVKKNTGLSIQSHIIQYKMKLSEKLLRQSKLSINEISLKLGFNDASHLNKIFKKYYGKSPLQFRSLR